MLNKIMLIGVLLALIFIQVGFIYAFGGYSAKYNAQAQFLDLWHSFGIQVIDYTKFIFNIVKIKVIWLLPLLELVGGIWAILTHNKLVTIMIFLLTIMITLAFYGAVYNPSMMIKL